MSSHAAHLRSPWLDSIRAVAILAVLIFHVATRYDREALDPVASFFLSYGFLGVDMFFPLSGFLITRYLLQTEHKSFVRTFFLRRVFRIFPLYYLAILIFVAASLATGVDRGILPNIWAPLTFTTGWFVYFEGPAVTPYQITWSLSVEEFAYVLLGLSAWLSRRHLPVFLFVLFLLPIALRAALYSAGHDHYYFLPPARIDAIALGGLLAWITVRGHSTVLISTAVVGVLWAVTLVNDQLKAVFFVDVVAALTCWAIAVFERHLPQQGPAWLRPVASVGFYSYFTYLIHFFVIYAVFEAASITGLAIPFWINVAISLAITHALAVTSWKLYEGPMIAFGRKLERG